MSDVHHRHHTISTTYLNSPCGRLRVPTGVPRKFIPLRREPRNLQSRSRLHRGIFLNFNPNPAGNPAGHSCSRSHAKLYDVTTMPRCHTLSYIARSVVPANSGMLSASLQACAALINPPLPPWPSLGVDCRVGIRMPNAKFRADLLKTVAVHKEKVQTDTHTERFIYIYIYITHTICHEKASCG